MGYFYLFGPLDSVHGPSSSKLNNLNQKVSFHFRWVGGWIDGSNTWFKGLHS